MLFKIYNALPLTNLSKITRKVKENYSAEVLTFLSKKCISLEINIGNYVGTHIEIYRRSVRKVSGLPLYLTNLSVAC